MNTKSLPIDQIEEKTIYFGKDPPDLKGKYIRLKFPDEETFEKDFVNRSVRYPDLMYEKKGQGTDVKIRKRIKNYIWRTFVASHSLEGYVCSNSRFIRTTRERRHKRYENNTYREIGGYQYYTVEFNFSSGLYEVTTDVALFVKVEEFDESTSTYWIIHPNNVKMEIIADE